MLSSLNHWCEKNAIALKFLYIGQSCPQLKSQGRLALDEKTIERAQIISRTLNCDEWHALVRLDSPEFPHEIEYNIVTYSQMLALREAGLKPTGLSATLLPINRQTQTLLLQKRAASSHLFPGYLSLLGGGFAPPVDASGVDASGVDVHTHDHDNPKLTAQRECFEESHLRLTIPENCLIAITQETQVGAVQINFLGVEADFSQAVADEKEGELVEYPLPEINAISQLPNSTDLLKGCLYAFNYA